MKPINKKAYSNTSPIAKIESLASILLIDKDELLDISNSINSLWKSGKRLRKKMVTQDRLLMQNLV